MSEQQTQTQPERQETVQTPQDVQAVNNRNRSVATRPGWIAGLAVLVFIGGLAAFMFSF